MENEKKKEALLVIVAGFLVLFFVFKIKIFILIALLVAVLGALSDFMADKITWVWFKIAEILGWINSKILLSLVFFLFLFPIALLMRLVKKDSFRLNKREKSYYTERDHLYTPADLENTW